MTREEILAMEPGDELDKLVAMKIMGFEQSNMRDGWVRVGALATYPKRYSTDISAAMEVVDKLDDGRHEIEMLKAPYYDDVWIVKIAEFEDVCDENGMYRTFEVQAESKSLPEAIAKAALLAVLEATP
jgi:hypothetical protein